MPTCIHLLDENEDEAWCGFLFWGWLCLPVRWQFTCHGIGQLPEIYTKELISHERRKTLVVRSEETHKSPRVHKLPNKCIEINYTRKSKYHRMYQNTQIGVSLVEKGHIFQKVWFLSLNLHYHGDTWHISPKSPLPPKKEKVADTALKMIAN